MDFDSIPYGVDFREHIKQTLQRAKVVVAIIGPEWLGEDDKSGRRIDDPTDFVRLEIAAALQHGIPLIPVLVNNTPMPEAKTLPAEIEGFAFRNGLALDTGIDFHHHTDRLIAGIHKVAGGQLLPVSTTVHKNESAPGRHKFAVAGAAALGAAVAGIAGWYFVVHLPNKAPSAGENTVPVRTESSPPVKIVESAAAKTQSEQEQKQKFAISEAISPAPAAPVAATSTTDAGKSREEPRQDSPAPRSVAPASTFRSPAEANSTLGEYSYSGKVGSRDATFYLRFETGERVTGTYTHGGPTYRLEGRNPKGKLFLDEYTGDQLTAHIELTLKNAPSEIRWEGIMRNTPPDNRVFPVSFARSSSPNTVSAVPVATPRNSANTNETLGEYTYRGNVGPYEATFLLRFEPGGRVIGSYVMSINKKVTLRLEGGNPKGKLLLDEYTQDSLTAHIDLTLKESTGEIRWEGTMHNTPPDNRVFSVSFARAR